MSTAFTSVSNENAFSPTGELGIVSGISNPIPVAAAPSQQVNVGDIICQVKDATFSGSAANCVGVPACALPTALAATGATAAAVSAAAMKAVHDAYIGRSLSYRSANNPSYGKGSDKMGVAVGRVKARIEATDYNYANFLPAGTLVGAVPVVAGSASSWTIAGVKPAEVQTTTLNDLGTSAGAGSVAVTAEYAIGRLAFDKQPEDIYVYVDEVSTVLTGGVQNSIEA